MRSKQRSLFALFLLGVSAAGAGCMVRWSNDGLCFKPLFRIQINRWDASNGAGSRGGGPAGTHDCHCIGEGGFHEGVIDGGFATSGPITVETSPIGAPIVDGAMLADTILPLQPPGVAHPGPVFGPNAQPQQPASAPPSSTGANQQEVAKKRPGSLSVSSGIQMQDRAQDGSKSSVLRIGQRTVFGVFLKNTGDLPIETTQLQGVFSSNVRPLSVLRLSGPSEERLASATTGARIEGQRVVFDRFDQLGPTQMHEYQVTAEVTASGPGNFEVTELSGPSVKKNTPITAVAQ